MSQSSSSSSGIGVFGLLGVVFVTLKLLGIIHWSWWWVTVPFWGGLALFVLVLVLIMVLALIFASRKSPLERFIDEHRKQLKEVNKRLEKERGTGGTISHARSL